MPVQVVLMDESSQIKEVDTLNAWARHMDRLRKLAVFGDQNQLPATIPSYDESGFGPTAQVPHVWPSIHYVAGAVPHAPTHFRDGKQAVLQRKIGRQCLHCGSGRCQVVLSMDSINRIRGFSTIYLL